MKRSDQAIQFIENLNLVGDYAGEPFVLRDWQKQILRRLFATDDEGKLIVSKMSLWLPRKNSKTTLASSILLTLLLTGGHDQQILSAASSHKQASLVFECMSQMIRQDELLSEICEIIPSKTRIVVESTNSFYEAVGSGPNAAHGYSPTCILCDEFHAWDKPRHEASYAGLTTGFGARKNPLTIIISTQSSKRNSLAHREFDYASNLKNRIVNGKVVRSGGIENPSYLSVLYYADDEKDDWRSRELWHRVNPALGDFMNMSVLEDAYKLASQIPSQQRSFKTLFLNMPMLDVGRWMDMSTWAEAKDEAWKLPQDCPVFVGVDIGQVNDLSALLLLFRDEDKYHVKSHFWCDKTTILERSNIHKIPYDIWENHGFIKLTEEEGTDLEAILEDTRKILEPLNVQHITADRMFASEICQQLAKDGYEVTYSRQGGVLAPATERIEKLLLQRKITHDGNPVMDFCMSNVKAAMTFEGHVYPAKKQDRQEMIDGAVSLIMAMNVAMFSEPKVVHDGPAGFWL